MKTTLYNIQNDYAALMDAIEEQEGVLTDEQNEALIINEKELQVKSVSYLQVIRKSEAFISQIDDESKRLAALKKRHSKLIERLENNLLAAVNQFGDFEVGTLTFTTKKTQSIIVDDVNSLPKEFKTIKVTESANKADLKAAIKGGKEIDGVILQTNIKLKVK